METGTEIPLETSCGTRGTHISVLFSAWGVWKVEVENMRGAEKGICSYSFYQKGDNV